MKCLLKDGHIVCNNQGFDQVGNIYLENGRIQSISFDGSSSVLDEETEIIDCKGKYIFPGLIDLSSFCGALGLSHREDFTSLSQAALAGGYTDIVLGPWGSPPVENAAVVTDLRARSSREPIRYHLLGTVVTGAMNQDLAEMGLMKEAGAMGFSDAKQPIASTIVLRNILQYAARLDLPVFLYPGDPDLDREGVMHEGMISTQIGLRGISIASEEIAVSRIVALAKDTKAKICILPVSTPPNIDLPSNVLVATPARSLLLSDASIQENLYDPNLHLRPPLRDHPERIKEAVRSGEIPIVFADHTPLTRVEKELEFALSEPGAIGLETALSASFTALSSIPIVLERMVYEPARFLGIKKGLQVGANSDIVIFDPLEQWCPKYPFHSKGINEPLSGISLKGKVSQTYFSRNS